MEYAKTKKLSHPTEPLHGDSQTSKETVDSRFLKFWGHLGTAHRTFLKVVKTAFFSTYRNRNSLKNREFSCMALKSTFLDRFWWNFYLYPLIRGRWVQIWWENYSLFTFKYRAIVLKVVILRQNSNVQSNCAVPKREQTVIFMSDLNSATPN